MSNIFVDNNDKDLVKVDYYPIVGNMKNVIIFDIKKTYSKYRSLKINLDRETRIIFLPEIIIFYKLILAVLQFIEYHVDELSAERINIEKLKSDPNVSFLFANNEILSKIGKQCLEIRSGDKTIIRKAYKESIGEYLIPLSDLISESLIIKETSEKLFIVIEAFPLTKLLFSNTDNFNFNNIVFIDDNFANTILNTVINLVNKIQLRLKFVRDAARIRVREVELASAEAGLVAKMKSYEQKEILLNKRIYELKKLLREHGIAFDDDVKDSIDEL